MTTRKIIDGHRRQNKTKNCQRGGSKSKPSKSHKSSGSIVSKSKNQSHGNKFENSVLLALGYTQDYINTIPKTNVYDGPKQVGKHDDFNFSIKTFKVTPENAATLTKAQCIRQQIIDKDVKIDIFDETDEFSGGIICSGDAIRFLNSINNANEKLKLYAIRYTQIEDLKLFVDITVFDMTNKKNLLIGPNIGLHNVEHLSELVKKVPKRIKPNLTSEYKAVYDAKQAIDDSRSKDNAILNLAPKMDSKSQRRLQSTIHYLELCKKITPELHSFSPIVNSVPIISHVISGTRDRSSLCHA
jgi:hypothetical protein